MNNKIRKLQWGDYFLWNNLSREDKVKRNKQIAKLYLDRGPSILNYYNALKAYFGGFNPKNPYLLTGEPTILPGMNPTKGILTATKAARTLEDYLKTTKVTAQALEGSSAARSAYATDRFIGGRLFLNTLPEEAMKILGHGMAKSPTILDALARLRYILDNGIKGKFYTAPLKVSKEAAMAGEAIGTGGATPYFDGHFLITGKPGLMINSVDDIGTIYINDAYENEEALKAAQKMKEYLTKTYPNKVFKLYSEGFKKGGSIKTANARKWKHKGGGSFIGYPSKAAYDVRLEEVAGFKKGGKAFVNGVSILDSNPDAYKYVKKKMKKAAGGTKLNNETILTIGKTTLNGILGFIQTTALNNNLLKLADALKALNKAQMKPEDFWHMMELEANLEVLNEMELAAAIKAMTGETINVNPDIARNRVWKRVAENYSKLKKAIDDLNKAIDAQVEAQKQSAWGNLAGSLILSGIGLLGNYLGNKTSTNNTNNTSSNSGGWTMNYNSLYGSKNNYNTFFLTGSLPKMNSVVAPNNSMLNTKDAAQFFK